MFSYPVAIMYSVTLFAVCFIVYLYWFEGTSRIYTRLAKLESDVSQLVMSQGMQSRINIPRPPKVGP